MELVNLALVQNVTGHTELLQWTTTVLRSALLHVGDPALRYIVQTIPHRTRADEAWMTIFNQNTKPPPDASVHDNAAYQFGLIDAILEGCYRPRFQYFSAFMSAISANASMPPPDARVDFGKLVADVPAAFEGRGALYFRDPTFGIRVSQWRNISAHRSFSVIAHDKVRAVYGKSATPRSVDLTLGAIGQVTSWCEAIVRTLRLAETLFFLDHAALAFYVEPPPSNLPLRLESALGILFHNFSVVGFSILTSGSSGDTFLVKMRDRNLRSTSDAIIHASQMLPALAIALADDPSTRSRHEFVRISLVDDCDELRAFAALPSAVGVAFTNRQQTQEELIDAIQWGMLKE